MLSHGVTRIVFVSVILSAPSFTFARGIYHEELEQNRMAIERAGHAAVLHNFRTGRMEAFAPAQHDLDVSAFLPSDEAYQGLFHDLRAAGVAPLEALRAVYGADI